MRLSWNEIRVRAAKFASDWEESGYEKGETQLFYRDFFDIFGIPVRRVGTFERSVKNLGDKRGFIDLFWKGVLLVEQKSAGRSLIKAKNQALDYFPGLKDNELPRFVLLSDFQNFELYDLDEDESVSFPLSQLPQNVEKFGFILGVQKRSFRDQDPVNIEAAELVGELHDSLKESGYEGHVLERFLVRTAFCLFADDTGIFEPRDIFLDLLEERTNEDGSDLGGWLSQLFQTLNTPESKRSQKLDEDLAQFPYINGDLFSEQLAIPSFDSEMRNLLIRCCRFDWSGISPAIFGSLFQSVMDSKTRRSQGAHYTTEMNILKVIEPLFLSNLRDELKKIKQKRSGKKIALEAFQVRLSRMSFFDPACGCGNFLIITYRELRLLELEVLRALRLMKANEFQSELDAAELSLVDVDQFYGIELEEFPARIAETAMWMMDHIMNNRLSLEFGQSYVRIPLRKSPHIVHGDALELDWGDILPPEKCSYVFGNPPFIGAKYQSNEQRAQVRKIASLNGKGGTLDYVSAWFIKGGAYATIGKAPVAFVSTNSITQGEQVAQLWPILLDGFEQEISFAHTTFAWGSDARGKAHVHVVIIGLVHRSNTPSSRSIFSYADVDGEPLESKHSKISPYLFDASSLANPHCVVHKSSKTLNSLPTMKIGSKPIDGGHYIFQSNEEKDTFLMSEPGAKTLVRPYVGSREFLNGGDRWILSLQGASPAVLSQLPLVKDRIAKVRKFRSESDSKPTQKIAATPTSYHVNVIPSSPFLVVPKVSSEKREYIPIGWLEPPAIPSDLVFVVTGASEANFALITSKMHMSWMKVVGGRHESRYRYSLGLVYNTFPAPPVSDTKLNALSTHTRAVLRARSNHPDSTLAELYDPDLMPNELLKAHAALDRAVEKLYRPKKFISNAERVEHLLALYEARQMG